MLYKTVQSNCFKFVILNGKMFPPTIFKQFSVIKEKLFVSKEPPTVSSVTERTQ